MKVLSRLLLGLDGAVVCGWGDECALDCGDYGLCVFRKDLAGRRLERRFGMGGRDRPDYEWGGGVGSGVMNCPFWGCAPFHDGSITLWVNRL